MVANFESHGFKVVASKIPKACAECPFLETIGKEWDEGICFLTGHITKDFGNKRMSDCPVTKRR